MLHSSLLLRLSTWFITIIREAAASTHYYSKRKCSEMRSELWQRWQRKTLQNYVQFPHGAWRASRKNLWRIYQQDYLAQEAPNYSSNTLPVLAFRPVFGSELTSSGTSSLISVISGCPSSALESVTSHRVAISSTLTSCFPCKTLGYKSWLRMIKYPAHACALSAETARASRSDETVFLPFKNANLYKSRVIASEASCAMLMVSLLSSAAPP